MTDVDSAALVAGAIVADVTVLLSERVDVVVVLLKLAASIVRLVEPDVVVDYCISLVEVLLNELLSTPTNESSTMHTKLL